MACTKALEQANKTYEEKVHKTMTTRKETIERAWDERAGTIEQAWKMFARVTG